MPVASHVETLLKYLHGKPSFLPLIRPLLRWENDSSETFVAAGYLGMSAQQGIG